MANRTLRWYREPAVMTAEFRGGTRSVLLTTTSGGVGNDEGKRRRRRRKRRNIQELNRNWNPN